MANSMLKFLDGLSDRLFVLSETLLKAPQQLILLALREYKVVIGELAVFLFQFALEFVPISFDFEFSHTSESRRDRVPAVSHASMESCFPKSCKAARDDSVVTMTDYRLP